MPSAGRGAKRGLKAAPTKTGAKPARGAARGPGRQPRAGLSPLAAINVAGALVAAGLFAVLLTGQRAAAAADGAAASVDARMADAGFRVENLHLQGASPHAAAELLRLSGVRRGQPILGLDLAEVRAGVETSGWVKSARVVRLLPDTLIISVEEKGHMAVWQHGGRTDVIDNHGRVIPGADPGRFPQLPLIVGAGAEETAADLLPMIRARPRVTERLEALVRVDRRRWDLRLKDGALIQLPAVGEDAALIRLDQLDGRQRVLELGFARVDLRDPELVIVRPREAEGTAAAAPVPAPAV